MDYEIVALALSLGVAPADLLPSDLSSFGQR
jgi:hypothetical protein